MKTVGCIALFMVIASPAHSDDVYLYSGYVLLNVKVIDSTVSHYIIALEDARIRIERGSVRYIAWVDVYPGSKVGYERYTEKALSARQSQAVMNSVSIDFASVTRGVCANRGFESGVACMATYDPVLGIKIAAVYEFARMVLFGIHIMHFEDWMPDVRNASGGWNFGLAYPFRESFWSPFMECGTGGKSRVSETDQYAFFSAGVRWYVETRWFLRGAVSMDMTSEKMNEGTGPGGSYQKRKQISVDIGVGFFP